MRLTHKTLVGLAVLALLGVVAVFLTKSSGRVTQPSITSTENDSAPRSGSATNRRTLFGPTAPAAQQASTGENTNYQPESAESATWEGQIDDILRDTVETDSDAKAEKLLALFPSLPPEAQLEAARHIVNLTSDEHYPRIHQHVTNPVTSDEVREELFSDLLNRPNSLKLPALLDIARNPQHPETSQARDILEVYLEDDYGNDWLKWEQKMNDWLKDNSD